MIIDQLPELGSVQETDEIPVERGTKTYKATLQNLKDLIGADSGSITTFPFSVTAGVGVALRSYNFYQIGRIVFGFIIFDVTSALNTNQNIVILSGDLPKPYDLNATAPFCNRSGPAGMAYISRSNRSEIKAWGATPVGEFNHAQFVYVAQ